MFLSSGQAGIVWQPGLGSSHLLPEPPEALDFPVGCQADQTQLGMSPSSQLLALNGMVGGGLWLAGWLAGWRSGSCEQRRGTKTLGSWSRKGARMK